MKTYQLLINGEWVSANSGKTFTTYNPTITEPIAEIAQADESDVQKAVHAARQAFEEGKWSGMPASQRGKYLRKLSELIYENLEEIAQLETQDVGKPIRDSRDEVAAAAYCFEYYAGAATRFFGETIPVSKRGLDFTLREPCGVCAVIVPWNFPFPMAAWKCAPALASGNTVILKPASYTPLTALYLGKLALEAGIPKGVFNIITGPGSTAGGALVAHPEVDKISFTGETSTGVGIMKSAADCIKRVSLELGGKSPNVVFADADVEKAARSSVLAVFGNCGQDCCARSRAFVEQSVYDQFVEAFIDQTQKTKIGNPMDDQTEIGPMVSMKQRETVCNYMKAGLDEGAKLAFGGALLEDGEYAKGSFLQPAVFTGASNSMKIAREEIFGPVLTVIPFTDEHEMVRQVNDSPYGLSGSVWTNNISKALRTVKKIRSGVLSINCNSSVHTEAPFGGYKQSGTGRDLGMYGLQNFTEVKNVFIDIGE
ncbi:MAG: aldehyde dehydrogenase family protein [Candidatus Hinthialibacter antarcticus]|nr:aldehyde dehydrogenase family protein [Candidatus Hinthialibacter antarcticus]